jgi:hypothetical protein
MLELLLIDVALCAALIMVAALVVIRRRRGSNGQPPASAGARGAAAGSAGTAMAPREIAIVPGFAETVPPDPGAAVPVRPEQDPHSHQRESFCVKRLAGASSVVCPCIAVWGWSLQRVIGLRRRRAGLPMMCAEITGCLNAAEGSPRPPACSAAGGQAASALLSRRVPWAAVAGSHACPVVMTACSCRRIAAAMMACAWVGLSLFCSLLVRCW